MGCCKNPGPKKEDKCWVKILKYIFCCWFDMWDGKACIIYQIIFCPIVLTFHAIRIFCCGCLRAYCDRMGAGLCRCFCSCCYMYTDKKFPPNDQSLGESRPDIEWKRGTTIEEGKHKGERRSLFDKDPEPSDIYQGGLGDCWLLSAMSSVCLIPGAIRRLFLTKERNPRGRYVLRLYDVNKHKWVRLAIDDYIPCKRGPGFQPAFAQVKDNELWVLLLEKAFARMYGSYAKIEGGMPSQAVQRMLGGDFVITFSPEQNGMVWARGPQEKKTEKEMFDIVAYYLRKKTVVSCWTHAQGQHEVDQLGIVSGHAYAILNARQFGKIRLVRCRNPWGKGEWKGAWSDHSTQWREHPEIARKLRAREAKEDGAFWMSWEDFTRVWGGIEVVDNASNIWTLGYSPVGKEGACCGPFLGWLKGCTFFWCLCQGLWRLFCWKDASKETAKVTKCCCGSCTLGPGCYWHSSIC
eukprot:Cvel_14653.t1-p1 / transcript=Cvel_14653.t1 / gene=Cvel_14653 / organism=Chromera_velia_CCMP2878 / gene_product=Calpain, putative / transcript_product=Calpain, putative / location=Cvel_scaffold1049:52718-58001(+) / protein_length=463 / sequence_SO=supercontig / SO=protein_coding / is_pseudo=false